MIKKRIYYTAFYLVCVCMYIALAQTVLWPNIFISAMGVLISFFVAGRFVRKRGKPKWIRVFRFILIFIHAPYILGFCLAVYGGYYANAFLFPVFIAPISALLIECFPFQEGLAKKM